MLYYMLFGMVILIWAYKVVIPQFRKTGVVKRKNANKRMRSKLKTKEGDLEVMGGERIIHDEFDFILDLRHTFSGITLRMPFSADSIKPKDIFQVLVGTTTDRPCFEVVDVSSIERIEKELEEMAMVDERAEAKFKKQKDDFDKAVKERRESEEHIIEVDKRIEKEAKPEPEPQENIIDRVERETKEKEDESLKCPVCEKVCKNYNGLITHLRVHKKDEERKETVE